MSRIHNHHFKAPANSQIHGRFRQAVALLLSIIIGIIISISAEAQNIFSKRKHHVENSDRACYLLHKKRTHLPKKRAASYSSKIKNRDISAQKQVSATTQDTIEAKQQILISNLPTPSTLQHMIIREMVAQSLKENKGNEPITLAPLYFEVSNNRFSAVDVNPFLIAVEFALQGRTIQIQDYTGLPADATHPVRQMMKTMGVSDDRIRIIPPTTSVVHSSYQASSKQTRIDFTAN